LFATEYSIRIVNFAQLITQLKYSVQQVYIGIAGNIGCGKTTLTKMLAEHYQWEPRYEAVVDNPYMDDYYKDLQRWSFPMEVFFLKERFKDALEISKSEHIVIQDRTLYEGVFVFTANNYEQGNLSDRDFETYMELYEIMTEEVKLPDLMIYLKASVPHLVENIQKRGRACEQNIPIEYLQGLNSRYEDFILNKYKGKVLILDVDKLDYKMRSEDFLFITNKIDAIISTDLTNTK
jgi:deoxyadenosine/deoxycytidine kinase